MGAFDAALLTVIEALSRVSLMKAASCGTPESERFATSPIELVVAGTLTVHIPSYSSAIHNSQAP